MELIRRIPNISLEWKLDEEELDLFHEIERLDKEVEEYEKEI